MGLFNRDTETPERGPLLLHAPAGGKAEFDESEFVDGYAVLRWESAVGGIGVAYSLRDGNTSPRAVIDALAWL
ncbi:hypothetical protein ACFU9X_40450 [Streptomyces atratus]|uniref:hypothetical protein n=1 Tax=Streptomyces atratus TaxID=1893 RepID=UPI0036A8E469